MVRPAPLPKSPAAERPRGFPGMTTRILNAECAAIEASAGVLLDTEAISEEEHERLRDIAGCGRYSPNDAALVRLALEGYEDAHVVVS